MANRLASLFSFTSVFLLASVFVVAGCTSNAPFRSQGLTDCNNGDCDEAFIEHHESYDLAFVEFTERGNVFRRENMQAVIDHVASFAKQVPEDPEAGVLAVVYVHGWKHNASPSNNNVASFKGLLEKTAKLTNGGPRRLVGIYVGWRGLSLDVPVVMNLSYWDRKEVAHQVGKGGVTELLLRLENAVIDDVDPNRNLFMRAASTTSSSSLSRIRAMLSRIVPSNSSTDCGR